MGFLLESPVQIVRFLHLTCPPKGVPSNQRRRIVYLCPAGERLTYRYTTKVDGKVLRNYRTTVFSACPLKDKCTTGRERRVKRWEHEAEVSRIFRTFDFG